MAIRRQTRFTRHFWVTVAGTLVGLMIWQLGASVWAGFGWWAVLVGVAALATLNGIGLAKYWIDGSRGLAQWPNPHGRYYDEWLGLPESAGDYYLWLAKQMGNREPWTTWARQERTLSAHENERTH